MTGWNMPPGCTEAMIPGNRAIDIEIEKLWDELDGTIINFLDDKENEELQLCDLPGLLKDLLNEYECRSGNRSRKKKIYECEDCGCKEVEGSAWIPLNTGKPKSDPAAGEGPIEGVYCPKCQCFVGLKWREE